MVGLPPVNEFSQRAFRGSVPRRWKRLEVHVLISASPDIGGLFISVGADLNVNRQGKWAQAGQVSRGAAHSPVSDIGLPR